MSTELLKSFTFGAGSHKSREDGMCVMEAVAFLAGEPHSDSPVCACPVISKLAIWLNDTASDARRQELCGDLPWRIVGTKATTEIERQRAFMAAEWAVAVVCPPVLRRARLNGHADKLAALRITDMHSAFAARDASYAARDASYAASYAARDAASYAALAASYAALAARAARAALAASYAALAASYAALAASYAARDAASDVDALLMSCRELLVRMIDLTEPKEATSPATQAVGT